MGCFILNLFHFQLPYLIIYIESLNFIYFDKILNLILNYQDKLIISASVNYGKNKYHLKMQMLNYFSKIHFLQLMKLGQ